MVLNPNWFCEVVMFHEPDGIDLPMLSTLLTNTDEENEYPTFANVKNLVVESYCGRYVLMNRSSLSEKSLS